MNPFKDLTDEELLTRYREGSYKAFETFYKRHKQRVYSYLKKRLDNELAVEEVFQSIFIKVHRQRNNYDSSLLAAKWLYTICRSELLDYCKKKKLMTVEFDELQHGHTENKKVTVNWQEMGNLSEAEKKAISLRFYSEEDHQEISRRLNTSEANARKLVSRGLAKLRLAMKGGHKS